jgi:2-polyprenyl-3-methyl-5-hydroxy-6-metoxy-1,4-benzoquinol methylase
MTRAPFSPIQQPGGWKSAKPLPTPSELREFYATLYYQDPQTTTYQSSYGELDLKYKELKCAALMHVLGRHGLPASGTVLDIGAGEGFLMDVAARQGYAVTGLDFSSFAVEKFFPRLKDRLIAGDVFETIGRLTSEGRRFGACSAINVMEHVIDPAALLGSLRGIVEPGGLLAITVPNDYSRLQELLRAEQCIDREFWFAPPQHLHYFNAENLPPFCESHGYELVDAFADFPIDLYLLHPGANYITSPANGPAAHRARMLHDLLIAERGMEPYLDVYRALFNVGIGRDITVVLRPRGV